MFYLTVFLGDTELFVNEPYSNLDLAKSAADYLVQQYGDSCYGFVVTVFDDGLDHIVYSFEGG